MDVLELNGATREAVAAWLDGDAWVVACLCARWCDVCEDWRAPYAALARRHPHMHFVWIDIEDEADTVGELEVENFPTLLVQRRYAVAFHGALRPDLRTVDAVLQSVTAPSREPARTPASPALRLA